MEQTVQKQRVAAYCRVFAGSEDHPASLAAQEAYYTEMVGRRPDWDLAGIYADRGITGTGRQNRKEFKKMLTACQKGKIDLILVKSVSRFSRNIMESLETVRMLKAHGVGVIFEKENIDTRMESGELHVTVFNELARMESESLEKSHGCPCRYARLREIAEERESILHQLGTLRQADERQAGRAARMERLREFVEQRETKFAVYDDAITRKFVEQITALNAETIRIKFRYPGLEVDKSLN